MKFEELYEKYLAGECTEEEKAFVKGEMEKAMIVNDAIMNGRKLELKPAEDEKVKKVKKKFGLKMLLTAVVVTFVVLLVATGATLGGVFGTAVGAANKSDALGMEQAQETAVDFVFTYLTGNGYYTGSKDAMWVAESEREFKMTTPLKESVYVYEFEIIARDENGGIYEIEVDVNGATGKCEIVDIEYEGARRPSIDIDWTKAEEKAIEEAYAFLTEKKGYTGTKESLVVVDREFEIKAYSGLGFSVYEFEIVAGQYEIEIVVNTHTDSCFIKDVEIRPNVA